MKNRRYHAGLIISLLVIIGVALTACGETSPLVGKWERVEDDAYIEFFSDGKADIWHETYLYSCTYEETGDNEVTLTPVSINGQPVDEEEPLVLEYSFSGDELTLTNGGDPETFTRVK